MLGVLHYVPCGLPRHRYRRFPAVGVRGGNKLLEASIPLRRRLLLYSLLLLSRSLVFHKLL